MSVCADFPAGISASTNHGVSVNLNIIGSLSIDTGKVKTADSEW